MTRLEDEIASLKELIVDQRERDPSRRAQSRADAQGETERG
jgi:hypothetical protein